MHAAKVPMANSRSFIALKDLSLKPPNSAGPLDMRFDISGQFVVNVVTPNGGTSKGRPIALIEEGDRWSIADLLIPNGLTERALETFLADKFAGFVLPARPVRRLDNIS
jgi:hypothetical protein